MDRELHMVMFSLATPERSGSRRNCCLHIQICKYYFNMLVNTRTDGILKITFFMFN